MYDLIIIGAGPGGYSAAINAGNNGLKVLLIESANIGGICLNEGCIPTKTLLYSAKILDSIKFGEKYGVKAENVEYNQGKVIDRKNKVVKTLVAGIKSSLKKADVTVVMGYGKILGKEGDMFSILVNDEKYLGKNIIVATGSSPIMPDIPGVLEMYKKGSLVTSKEILDLKYLPKTLSVIGGGVVGFEMAAYFNSVGVKVSIIKKRPNIGDFDSEITEILVKNYAKKGIDFYLDSDLVEVKDGSVCYECKGDIHEIQADIVLMSKGRFPNVKNLGLEEIGVNFDKKGISTDNCLRTNIPGIYAIGDVNGKVALAHTAYREADVCINTILGTYDSMDYVNIPSVIYTNPEVSYVGETEQTAKKKGIDFEVINIPMRYSGRYVAENEGGNGICKIVYSKNDKVILGVHMIANYSSEIIFGVVNMIQNKQTIDELKKVVFPHPTVSEIIREGLNEIRF